MSGLESIIATGSDVLAGPLDFQVGQDQASYIVNREQQSFFSSQNIVNPTSVRTLKFQIGSNGFLDLSTLVFAFDLHETGGTNSLQPLTCEAHHLFRRMIIRISGTMVENKELFSREEEFARRLLPAEKRKDLANMYLGVYSDGGNGDDLVANRLPANGQKKVLFRPLTSAILNMSKYLPALLLSTGMTIELELADAIDAMAQSQTLAGQALTHSQAYELLNCRVLCDQVTLTSELTDQYTSLLLSGKSLYIDLPSLSDNTVQFFPGNEGKFSIVSSRQYSRLNTLIVTFCQAVATNGLVQKDVNNFYLPASAEDTIASNLVINGSRMPAFDNSGIRQHWNRFLRAVGAYGGIGTSTSISFKGFGGQSMTDPVPGNPGAATTNIARSFAVIFDLEKMSMHSSTGEPMSSGSGLTINVEHLGAAAGEYATKAYITAHHSGVLEIRDSGCAIYT